MKWTIGLVAVVLLGVMGWQWGPGFEDERSHQEVEGSERVMKSERARQLEEVRAKSSRLLNAESAQGKIEDFLNSTGNMSGWDQKTVGEFNALSYSWGGG